MKTINRLCVFLGSLAVVAVAGCASPPTKIDRNFGDAVRAAVAQQTINPDASLNRDPVAGIDGRAGVGAIDKYRNTFEPAAASQGSPLNILFGAPATGTPASQ